MTKGLRIYETGPPGVFRWEDVDVSAPGPGEVRLRQTAVGLNFVDPYHRGGLYHPWKIPPLPAIIGLEAAGVVEECGDGVNGFAPGMRVGYATPPVGAYCEARVMPADHLVALPDDISDVQAAGMMLKGLTAQYLLRRTFAVGEGDWVLIHAAAGGMGSILCQWAKHLGAVVIGTVGTDEKAEIARAQGCDHPIVYSREDFLPVVRELTDGAGVAVVYESVGKDTFARSLDCLRPMGYLVSYGAASGAPELDNIGTLGEKGSLFLTRPRIMDYMDKRSDLDASAAELFDVVRGGAVRIEVKQTYPLKDMARAHDDLEQRRTTGSTVLLV